MRSASLASGTRVLDAIKQMGAKHTVTQPFAGTGIRVPSTHHPQIIRATRRWATAGRHIERAQSLRSLATSAASAACASSSCGPADEHQQPQQAGIKALAIVLGAFAATWSSLAGAVRSAAVQARA